MTFQIIWGSLALVICSAFHVVMVVWWARALKQWNDAPIRTLPFVRSLMLIGGTFVVIVFAHTVQVWLWAVLLLLLKALPNLPDAIYFSLVTYTTVGYGDMTLSNDFRIFGAMASVTGLLSFGLSTAFLVGLLAKLFPEHLN